MFIDLIFYFLGIYLPIAVYVFLPEKFGRFWIIAGLYIIFTLSASNGFAKWLNIKYAFSNDFLMELLLTITFALLSLCFSGAIVKKISDIVNKGKFHGE